MPATTDRCARGGPPQLSRRQRPRRELAVEETILGTRVHPSNYADATGRILGWASRSESRYVCVANVHMLMEAHDDPTFRDVVNGADFVTSDGMPLVWLLRARGYKSAERVYGPDLTPAICSAAATAGIPVGFFGGEDSVRIAMVDRLRERFPTLDVVYSYSPPFRPLSAEEEAEIVNDINASGARILFVGLGCPKQERWMARHVGRVDAVMIGVGAAFDFIAGTKPKAPPALQRFGLEWLFRLACEPRRLWRRYLYHNPRFVVLAAAELIRSRTGRGPAVVGNHPGY